MQATLRRAFCSAGSLALSDIGNPVTFLASDRAAVIIGAVIPIDGGILTT